MSRLVSGGSVTTPGTDAFAAGIGLGAESDGARMAVADTELPGLPPVAVSRGWGDMSWRRRR